MYGISCKLSVTSLRISLSNNEMDAMAVSAAYELWVSGICRGNMGKHTSLNRAILSGSSSSQPGDASFGVIDFTRLASFANEPRSNAS